MPPVREARRCRVLVVAPNWLGDVVMATPLLEWLAGARRAPDGPALHVTLAVRAAWAPLFVGDSRCDSLLMTERPGRHAGWAGVWRQAALWRAGRFDAVLLGPPSLRAALVAALAGIPCRVGHRGDGRAALLTRALPRARRGHRHYSLELLDLGAALAEACRWSPAALPALTGLTPRLAAAQPAVDGRADTAARPWWGLGLGTTFGPAKNWPTAPMADFVRTAVRDEGARIVLLGDAAAAPLAAALRAATNDLRWATSPAAVPGADQRGDGAVDVLDLTGRTDLPQVVAWLRACALYVGGDSGLMHLAAALGTPTVGVFGSSNPEWTGPAGAATAAVVAEGFACRPCYRRTCDQPVFCLDRVEGARVMAAALDVLGRKPAGRGRDDER
jgi:heptosyltransferase II